METEKKLYKLYTDPKITENERNSRLFSEIYPLFLNKTTGSFFTSPSIANMVIKHCIGGSYLKNSSKILDPACGIGEFLISAANEILERVLREKEISSKDEVEIRQEIIRNCLFGFDIDKGIVYLCKFRLLLWSLTPILRKQSLKLSEVQSLYQNFECNIRQCDFFEEFQTQNAFDIILCNPPFNAEMLKSQKKYLQKKFPRIIRNSAAYFYLLCESLLRQQGKMGFILPKSVAYSKRWRTLKNHILKQLEFTLDISKAFSKVKLEEIILITNKESTSPWYVTQENSHKPIQVKKEELNSAESLILSISPSEFELYKQFSALPKRLEEFIIAYRGLNVQKLAVKYDEEILDPIFCIGGKEIKPFYHFPANRIIQREKKNGIPKKMNLGTILGQLANAHVKNPRPHYNLAFTNAPTSSRWITFDTIINISLNNLEGHLPEFFKDYLLCFLNSDIFAWYLYKIVYAGAIRSTRLDAEYLYKVPFLPVQPKDQKLLYIFHLFVNCLTFLSGCYYRIEQSTPTITEMLKKLKRVMNSIIFMHYFSNIQLQTWVSSVKMSFEAGKCIKNIDDASKMLKILWNSTYSKIMQQLRKTEHWKILIIE